MASDLVRFQDAELEHLRALLVYKSQLAGARFRELVRGLDNPSLRAAMEALADDAEEEKAALESLIVEWMRHQRPPSAPPKGGEPTSRDLVETWIGLQEAAAARYLEAAAAAPTSEMRVRLEQLAHRDAMHARLLRELL